MRFSLLSSLVLLFFPLVASSLGLGDISINSSLNSPLDAKIELKSATPQDIESLDVKMASSRDLLRSDIEKLDILKKIKFKLITNNGAPYIHVTTNSILREPFVNFLIDIQWQSGRILREYTLLVDPPEIATQGIHKDSSLGLTKTSPSRNTEGPQAKQPQSSSSTLTYGPTSEDDTLWSVAYRMRPSTDISMSQMMLAIQDENPQAFNRQNINGLMSGYTLKVLKQDLSRKFTKAEAELQVKEQKERWDTIVNKTAPLDERQREASSVVQMENMSVQDKQEEDDKSKLELLSSDEIRDEKIVDKSTLVSEIKVSATLEQLAAKLALYEERIQSQVEENEELKKHIHDLEAIIEKRESLVTLKDENLAILQANEEKKEQEIAAKESGSDNKETDKDTLEDKLLPENEQAGIPDKIDTYTFNEESFPANTYENIAEDSSSESPISDTESSETNTAEQSSESPLEVPPQVVETEVATDNQKTGTPEMAAQPKLETTPVEKIHDEVKQPVKLEKTKEPEYKALSSIDLAIKFAQDIYKNYFIESIVAGGSLFLLLLVSIFSRRSKNKEEDGGFQESILNSSTISDDSDYDNENDSLDTADMGESAGLEDETSFLSDFSSSELDGLQPDDTDSDPISEANVFMVYGRYDQAEELLNGEIAKQPDRLDYQMKLLEVYQGDKRPDEFSKQSAVVKSLLLASGADLDSSDEWKSVQKLSNELDIVDLNMVNEPVIEEPVDDISTDSSTAELELGDDEIDVDDLERQLNEFEAMLGDDLDDESYEDELEEKIEDIIEVDTEISISEPSESSELQDDILMEDDSLNLDNLDGVLEEPELEEQVISEEMDDLLSIEEDEKTELGIDLEALDGDDFDLEDTNEILLAELDDSSSLEVEDSLLGVEDSLDDLEIDLEDLDASLSVEDSLSEVEESLPEVEDSLPEVEDSLLEVEDSLDNMDFDLDDLEDSLTTDDSLLEVEDSLLEVEDSLLKVDDSNQEEESLDNVEIDLEDLSDSLDDISDLSVADDLDLDILTDELEDISTDLTSDEDIVELDKMGSALDLAKARIEMGDEESKKSAIKALNIVLKEGDEEQKSIAQKLMDLT